MMTSQLDGRKHYMGLDGLRGIAALVVVCYHIFEAFALSPLNQTVNHGYLAVDFFFLLSGFVLSYSYDEPNKHELGFVTFIKKRFIRLHPMLIVAALLGGALFYLQSTPEQNLSLVPPSVVCISVLMSIFLVPVSGGYDVRGYSEMFPLNGASWSLFFEYIGSLFYILVLKRIPKLGLYILTLGFSLWTIAMVSTSVWGYNGSGWSMEYDQGWLGGLSRVLTSMTLGVLLSRYFKPIKIKRAFEICSIILVLLLVMPRLGGADSMWLNVVYELLCVLLFFPLLLLIGASENCASSRKTAVCKFLGDISYPLYIIHYPSIYLYIAWVKTNSLTFEDSLGGVALLFVVNIILAQVLLRVYDMPFRKYLKRKML